MASNTDPHVLIIGAGITGLLVGHGLQKAGIPFTLFESEEAETFRPREWTMGIHWGLPLMEQLLPPSLSSRIPTDGSVDSFIDYNKPPNNGAYIYDGVTGKMLKDLTVDGRIVRVSRRRLRALCSEGLDVKYGHSLQEIKCDGQDNVVTAIFKNGSKYTGNIVIGCDGPRSAVRKYLFRSRPEDAETKAMDGLVTINTNVCYSNAETARSIRSAHPIWCLCVHPQMLFFISVQRVPDPEKPEDWMFTISATWHGQRDETATSEQRLAELKRRGKDLAEPFRTAILGIPENNPAPYIDVGCWIAKPWDTENGRVTLAGDAAHPMPPFRGQGCNHATQDAHNFVEMVKQIRDRGCDPQMQHKLVEEYSREVATRGAEETQLSMKNGNMITNYDDFMDSPYMKQGLSKG